MKQWQQTERGAENLIIITTAYSCNYTYLLEDTYESLCRSPQSRELWVAVAHACASQIFDNILHGPACRADRSDKFPAGSDIQTMLRDARSAQCNPITIPSFWKSWRSSRCKVLPGILTRWVKMLNVANIRPAEHQLLSGVISCELADRWHVLLLFLTAAASYLVAHCAAAVWTGTN